MGYYTHRDNIASAAVKVKRHTHTSNGICVWEETHDLVFWVAIFIHSVHVFVSSKHASAEPHSCIFLKRKS